MGKFEELQVQVAETQVRIMLEQEKHAKELRRLELQKAKIELNTAERLNLMAVRLNDSEALPPIKLS